MLSLLSGLRNRIFKRHNNTRLNMKWYVKNLKVNLYEVGITLHVLLYQTYDQISDNMSSQIWINLNQMKKIQQQHGFFHIIQIFPSNEYWQRFHLTFLAPVQSAKNLHVDMLVHLYNKYKIVRTYPLPTSQRTKSGGVVSIHIGANAKFNR